MRRGAPSAGASRLPLVASEVMIVRPLLLPALRRLWRDRSTLQLGVDPARAVVLNDVGPATSTVLALLDGRHTLDDVVSRSRPLGVPEDSVTSLVEELAGCGFVVDGDPASGLPRRMPAAARRRLEPDLAALSLAIGAAAGRRLGERSRRTVVVKAGGRIGPIVAALLGASGIGRVSVAATGRVTAADVAVGGLLPDDEQRPYAVAAADVVRRVAPQVDTRTPSTRRKPDLVVLASSRGPPPAERLRWTSLGVPHLPVQLRDGTALVGPLVVPGTTSCLECVELHRSDRDPAWPALAVQLATASRATEPCHAAVATAAGALAAMQVLCYLDGGEPEALGATLELTELGARVRCRPWPRHPRCNCAARPLRPPA